MGLNEEGFVCVSLFVVVLVFLSVNLPLLSYETTRGVHHPRTDELLSPKSSFVSSSFLFFHPRSKLFWPPRWIAFLAFSLGFSPPAVGNLFAPRVESPRDAFGICFGFVFCW